MPFKSYSLDTKDTQGVGPTLMEFNLMNKTIQINNVDPQEKKR